MPAIFVPHRFADVLDDHLMNPLDTARLMHQIITERRCDDLGNVLVFGDRVDLVQIELAHTDDVVLRDHGVSSRGYACWFQPYHEFAASS